MYERTKTAVILTVLCFACLIPESEGYPARECPDIVEYRYEDPNTVAYVTVPAPPRRGTISFEISYRVPSSVFRGSEGTLAVLNADETQSSNLRYRIVFDFGDFTPAIVSILLNGRPLCSAPDQIPQYSSTLATLSHNISYSVYEGPSYVEPETSQRPFYIPPSRPAWGPTYFEPGTSQRPIYTPPRSPVWGSTYFEPGTSQRPVYTPRPEPVRRRTTTTPVPIEDYPSSINDEEECGLPPVGLNQLIIGGNHTQRGDWPWLVPLFHLPGLSFKCGSTIVSHRYVITAAHCVMVQGLELEPKQVVLKIGAFDLGRIKERQAKIMKLTSIKVHEEYDPYSGNDLAILKTMDPITFSHYVKPICLWQGDSDQRKLLGREAVVLGWGKTQKDIVSRFPQKISVPIVTLEECRASSDILKGIASDKTICAGSRDGTGPCNGDSGGGLFLKEGNRWRLRGIVSVSVGENRICDLRHFVLYTDLTKYIQWLRRYMR